MKKNILIMVGLLLLFSQNIHSQINHLEILRNSISSLLNQRQDGNFMLGIYMLDSFIDVDSVINKTYNDFTDFGITDPYQTLSNCVLFTAIDTSMNIFSRTEHFGIYKNDQIIWFSEGNEDCSRGRFLGTLDLNNDGTVDIVTASNSGANAEYEQIRIYSWNGISATEVNEVDEEGYSSITILNSSCEIIDINGDDLYEIKGSDKIYNGDGGSVEVEVYSWNGSKYGIWASTPDYIPNTFSVANHISAEVFVKARKEEDSLLLNYRIKNNYDSEQSIKYHFITTSIKKKDFQYSMPDGWDFFTKIAPLVYFEAIDNNTQIRKNTALSGFQLKAVALPTISAFYLQAEHLKPDYPVEEFTLHYPEYLNDIYNNSLKIITVCPEIPPFPFDAISFLDTLIIYSYRSAEFGWITTQLIENKYDSLFTLAKTQLQQNNNSAARTTLQTVLQEVDIDSTNNLTSEAYALLRYNTEYLVEQLPAGVETISTYSIFATHSVWIRQNSDILSGSVGVNEAGEGPFLDSKLELSVGKRSTTPAGYTVKGNRIKVKKNATVNADVYHNELTNKGTITGSLNTPLELPLIVVLPEFQTSTPGTENIVVPKNGEYILLPGSYNDIKVKKNGKLIFTGGEYNINNIDGNNNNQLLLQSSSEVKIKDKFYAGKGSYIGPEDTTTLSADEIVFYIEGINGKNGRLNAKTKASKVGAGSRVKANFYVPNGTMWIRKDCEAEGSFVGKDVKVGAGTIVKLNSAW